MTGAENLGFAMGKISRWRTVLECWYCSTLDGVESLDWPKATVVGMK